MRVMVIVKASKESENGVLPTDAELSEMLAFNDKLVKAGIMLAGDGLQPSKHGVRIQFPQKVVIDVRLRDQGARRGLLVGSQDAR